MLVDETGDKDGAAQARRRRRLTSAPSRRAFSLCIRCAVRENFVTHVKATPDSPRQSPPAVAEARGPRKGPCRAMEVEGHEYR